MAYKCPCDDSFELDRSIGRYLGPQYKLADQGLDIIEKVSKISDPLSRHLECPWQAYQNPLWKEICYYLNLEEIKGTKTIDDNTNNIVFEALLFYKNAYSRIDGYVQNKEFEKREEERKQNTMKNNFKNK